MLYWLMEDVTILEEFDAIAVSECDDSLDYQILTISFPPENLSGIFHRDTGIKINNN